MTQNRAVSLCVMILCMLLCCTVFAPRVHAFVEPAEQLADPAQEDRARALSKLIRCPVCDSQNIDESDADISHTLRDFIRERIKAGDTDQAILDALHSRYGDMILMSPPVRGDTYMLWFAPLLLLALGGAAATLIIRKAGKA